VTAGFYVILAAALAVYPGTWRADIVAGDAIKLIRAAGLATGSSSTPGWSGIDRPGASLRD
jgi:hypothetical protein